MCWMRHPTLGLCRFYNTDSAWIADGGGFEESVGRYLQQLDSADRQEPSEALKTKTSRLKEKIEKLKEQMLRLMARICLPSNR
jgi:hypothetical protein